MNSGVLLESSLKETPLFIATAAKTLMLYAKHEKRILYPFLIAIASLITLTIIQTGDLVIFWAKGAQVDALNIH